MDDELKLVEELDAANAALASLAAYGEDALLVPVSLATRAIAKAAPAITHLHAEIEALKSDVDELVRAGSDEATENERLVKERDEANVRVRAITEVLNFSAEQTQKAEAQRDAALQLSTLTSSHDEVKALADAIAQRDELRHELVTANICLDKAVKDRDVAREALRQIAAVRPEVVTHVPEGFEPVLSCQQIASRTLEGGEG